MGGGVDSDLMVIRVGADWVLNKRNETSKGGSIDSGCLGGRVGGGREVEVIDSKSCDERSASSAASREVDASSSSASEAVDGLDERLDIVVGKRTPKCFPRGIHSLSLHSNPSHSTTRN